MTEKKRILPECWCGKRFTLLECLFYAAATILIVNLGTVYLLQLHRGHRRQEEFLNRTALAVLAGRRIKCDIERADAMEEIHGEFTAANGDLIVRHPDDKVVVYRMENGTLLRLALESEVLMKTEPMLTEVDEFEFQTLAEGTASFLLVNLRLQKHREQAGPEPFFTFKAAPGQSKREWH